MISDLINPEHFTIATPSMPMPRLSWLAALVPCLLF